MLDCEGLRINVGCSPCWLGLLLCRLGVTLLAPCRPRPTYPTTGAGLPGPGTGRGGLISARYVRNWQVSSGGNVGAVAQSLRSLGEMLLDGEPDRTSMLPFSRILICT